MNNYIEKTLEYALEQDFDSVKEVRGSTNPLKGEELNQATTRVLEKNSDVVQKVVTDSLSGGKDYRGILVPESVINALKLDDSRATKFAEIIEQNKESTNEKLLAELEKESKIQEREYWVNQILERVAIKDKERLAAILYDTIPLETLRNEDKRENIEILIGQATKLADGNFDSIKSMLEPYKSAPPKQESPPAAAEVTIERATAKKMAGNMLQKAATNANPQLWRLKKTKINDKLKTDLTDLLSAKPELEKDALEYLQNALKEKEFCSRLHSTSTIKTKDLEKISEVLKDAKNNPDNFIKRNIIDKVIAQAGLTNKKDKIYSTLGKDLLKLDMKVIQSREFQLNLKRNLEKSSHNKFGISSLGKTIKTSKFESIKDMLSKQTSSTVALPHNAKERSGAEITN